MTKALKELIENAKQFEPDKHDGKLIFDSILLINTGKTYKGFWGKNGFKNIILIGTIKSANGKVENYRIDCSQYDIVQTNFNKPVYIEIPSELNCIHFYDSKLVVSRTNISCVEIKTVR